MVFDPVETAQARCPIPANSFFLGTSSSPEPTRITRPPNLPEMLGQFCSMEIEARSLLGSLKASLSMTTAARTVCCSDAVKMITPQTINFRLVME